MCIRDRCVCVCVFYSVYSWVLGTMTDTRFHSLIHQLVIHWTNFLSLASYTIHSYCCKLSLIQHHTRVHFTTYVCLICNCLSVSVTSPVFCLNLSFPLLSLSICLSVYLRIYINTHARTHNTRTHTHTSSSSFIDTIKPIIIIII